MVTDSAEDNEERPEYDEKATAGVDGTCETLVPVVEVNATDLTGVLNGGSIEDDYSTPIVEQLEVPEIEPDREENVSQISAIKDEEDDIRTQASSVMTSAASNIASEFRCPICWDLLHEPSMIDPCNHVFCDPCLRRLGGQRHSRCPMCRASIKECKLNQELKETVRDAFPARYAERAETEQASGVYEMPLPPIRGSFLERLSEWTLTHMSNPYILTIFALIAVMVQLAVVISLSMLAKSKRSHSSVISLLKGLQGLASLRGAGGGGMAWRRPLMVKVIFVYADSDRPDAIEAHAAGNGNNFHGMEFDCRNLFTSDEMAALEHELFF